MPRPKGVFVSSGSRSSFFYYGKDNSVGFKEIGSIAYAEIAIQNQMMLSQYDFAPRVLSELTKIMVPNPFGVGNNKYAKSGWGYKTEVAAVISGCGNSGVCCECEECDELEEVMNEEIQRLVNDIFDVVGLEFVDAHIGNVGYIIRDNVKKLVCIDTGIESFNTDYSYYQDYNYI